MESEVIPDGAFRCHGRLLPLAAAKAIDCPQRDQCARYVHRHTKPTEGTSWALVCHTEPGECVGFVEMAKQPSGLAIENRMLRNLAEARLAEIDRLNRVLDEVSNVVRGWSRA